MSGDGAPELTSRATSEVLDPTLFAAAFAESPMPTVRTTVRDGCVGIVLDANPAACRLLGTNDPVGATLDELGLRGPPLPVADRAVRQVVALSGSRGSDVRWVGVVVTALSERASPGRPAALVCLYDVTEHRVEARRLDAAARHDPLTGLANRDQVLTCLAGLDPAADGPLVGVLFADLDHFKQINDRLGHSVGDELLTILARRIRGAVRPGDLLARYGGDEFVVVCPRLGAAQDALTIGERVRATLDQPVGIEGITMRVTLSVGVTTARVDGADPRALLRSADAAMYAAKAAGGDRVQGGSLPDPG